MGTAGIARRRYVQPGAQQTPDRHDPPAVALPVVNLGVESARGFFQSQIMKSNRGNGCDRIEARAYVWGDGASAVPNRRCRWQCPVRTNDLRDLLRGLP